METSTLIDLKEKRYRLNMDLSYLTEDMKSDSVGLSGRQLHVSAIRGAIATTEAEIGLEEGLDERVLALYRKGEFESVRRMVRHLREMVIKYEYILRSWEENG